MQLTGSRRVSNYPRVPYNSRMNDMKPIAERIRDIISSTESDMVKEIKVLQIIADDRRDSMYRFLEIEKTHGPKWVEKIRKMAERAHGEKEIQGKES